jgi:hypothetical protein
MSVYFSVLSSSEVSFLIFSLDGLSVGDCGVFRSPSITVFVSISALRATRVFFLM